MKHSKTSLFLMELIISIMFFAIASAVCIQLFVKSYQISTSSVELNHAVQWAENAAEVYYSCSGDLNAVGGILSEKDGFFVDDTNGLQICFDTDWKPICEESQLKNTGYYLLLVVKKEADMPTADIQVRKNVSGSYDSADDTEIYSLHNLLLYQQKGGD